MRSLRSVKAKILLLAGAAVTAMVLLTAVNIYSVENGIQALALVFDNRVQPVIAIQGIERDLKEIRFRMAGVLLDQMPAVGSNIQLQETVSNLTARWAHFKDRTQDNEMSPESRSLIARIDQGIPVFLSFAQKLSTAYGNSDNKAISTLLEDEWPAIQGGLVKPVEQLVVQQEDSVKTSYEANRKTGRQFLALGALAFLLTSVFITIIARLIVRAIAGPMRELIAATREIGESGDLEQTLHVAGNDEIGELGRTFAAMVGYLKEMAKVSEAIARGDLAVKVEPRSRRDTLGQAFANMVDGLRNIVGAVRDAATQVAAASNQVADASAESANVGVKSSSAIDGVTTTMHEMSVNVQNMVKNTQASRPASARPRRPLTRWSPAFSVLPTPPGCCWKYPTGQARKCSQV